MAFGGLPDPRSNLRGQTRFELGPETDFIDRLRHLLRSGWRKIGLSVTLQLRNAHGVGEEGEQTRRVTVGRERVCLREELFYMRFRKLPRHLRMLTLPRHFCHEVSRAARRQFVT